MKFWGILHSIKDDETIIFIPKVLLKSRDVAEFEDGFFDHEVGDCSSVLHRAMPDTNLWREGRRRLAQPKVYGCSRQRYVQRWRNPIERRSRLLVHGWLGGISLTCLYFNMLPSTAARWQNDIHSLMQESGFT